MTKLITQLKANYQENAMVEFVYDIEQILLNESCHKSTLTYNLPSDVSKHNAKLLKKYFENQGCKVKVKKAYHYFDKELNRLNKCEPYYSLIFSGWDNIQRIPARYYEYSEEANEYESYQNNEEYEYYDEDLRSCHYDYSENY